MIMETVQNKMISVFMEWTEMGLPIIEDYHSMWDLLMPVVEKIESLGHSVLIDGTQCKIFMDYDYVNSYKDSKIESVYESVVKFIEWYNEQTIMDSIKAVEAKGKGAK